MYNAGALCTVKYDLVLRKRETDVVLPYMSSPGTAVCQNFVNTLSINPSLLCRFLNDLMM